MSTFLSKYVYIDRAFSGPERRNAMSAYDLNRKGECTIEKKWPFAPI